MIASTYTYITSSTVGGVALGVSALRDFQPDAVGTRRVPPSGWWVVKYFDEARIFLPNFDGVAIRKLSDEFGLVLVVEGQTLPSDRVRQHYFFTSPAWDSLRRWVVKHPRIAKTEAGYDSYFPGWYQRAMIEAQALAA